jgi:ketosteroid isomerase-like protein
VIGARAQRSKDKEKKMKVAGLCVVAGLVLGGITAAAAATYVSSDDDAKVVAALDKQYQAAVEKNDATTMSRILADDFVLVVGSGKSFSKTDLLTQARSGRIRYERQDDSAQTVRVWGDAAVVTAKLWAKGTDAGQPFEQQLWFSDVYIRTPTGWRYAFGQASLPLAHLQQEQK